MAALARAARALQPAARRGARTFGGAASPPAAPPLAPALRGPRVPLWDSTQKLLDGLLAGDRVCLARAITLIESTRDDHRAQTEALLDALLAAREVRAAAGAAAAPGGRSSTGSFRIGIAGPPGAGKSSLIEAVGMHLIAQLRRRLAVVAIDPSSSRTGGSILGDKTRMERLAREPDAYVRASPTRGALGGVAQSTHEAILLCEGAGFETVLVETVGLGQSEVAVDGCVDMVWLVLPPTGGDELQGVKKGIVEVVDAIIINKADGALVKPAEVAAAE
jgi:LAO/AO transport system kinase